MEVTEAEIAGCWSKKRRSNIELSIELSIVVYSVIQCVIISDTQTAWNDRKQKGNQRYHLWESYLWSAWNRVKTFLLNGKRAQYVEVSEQNATCCMLNERCHRGSLYLPGIFRNIWNLGKQLRNTHTINNDSDFEIRTLPYVSPASPPLRHSSIPQVYFTIRTSSARFGCKDHLSF